jgi:uncharacterized protein (TIGR02453 family)
MDTEFVFSFLRDLARHNDREWFQSQADRYQDVRLQFKEFVDGVLDALARDEPAWGALDAGDCLFRIHRDVRFSSDKSPYKTNVSAVICPGGKMSGHPGVYVSLEPGGKSELAGGLYTPTTAELLKIRTRIAADATPLRAILKAKAFRKCFPEGLNGERAKTLRGFPKDHPAADLLRVKSHIAWRHLTDEEVLAKDFPKLVVACFRAMIPLCRWLDQARV